MKMASVFKHNELNNKLHYLLEEVLLKSELGLTNLFCVDGRTHLISVIVARVTRADHRL